MLFLILFFYFLYFFFILGIVFIACWDILVACNVMEIMAKHDYVVKEQVTLVNSKWWYYTCVGIASSQSEHLGILGLVFMSSKTELLLQHCHPSMTEDKDLNKLNVFQVQHRLNKKLWDVSIFFFVLIKKSRRVQTFFNICFVCCNLKNVAVFSCMCGDIQSRCVQTFFVCFALFLLIFNILLILEIPCFRL